MRDTPDNILELALDKFLKLPVEVRARQGYLTIKVEPAVTDPHSNFTVWNILVEDIYEYAIKRLLIVTKEYHRGKARKDYGHMGVT